MFFLISRDVSSIHSVSSLDGALSAVLSESVVHTVLTSMSSKRASCSYFETLILLSLKLIGNSIEILDFELQLDALK